MRVARRLAASCAALVIMLLVLGVSVAGAQTSSESAETTVTYRIFADYADNGVIDGSYSAADLDSALRIARESGSSFAGFASAVSDKYDHDIGGFDVSSASTGDEGSLLPVPAAPGERDQPPWPFLALTALGAALVVTGAGSSIYRRARR